MIVANISDKDIVNKYFQEFQFEFVINFAAESHVNNSITDATVFLKTNIISTHVLLEAARNYGCSRFHQVSTDELYADLPLNRADLKFDEQHRIIPSSPYAASKASADLLAFSYYRTYGLNVSISRCSNNYGPF